MVEELPAIETVNYHENNLDDLINECHRLMSEIFTKNSAEAKEKFQGKKYQTTQNSEV